MTITLVSDGVAEFDLSGAEPALVTQAPLCGETGDVTSLGFAATDDVDGGMSLASIPISSICLARFSA